MKIKTSLKAEFGVLELTPLVDVFFLLLIFFVISSSLVFQPGIQVDLPKATGNHGRGAAKIIVTVTQTGLLFLNDNSVKWSELERELRELVRNRRVFGAPVMVLRADEKVSHGRIVEIMSLARSLDLAICLATASPAPANGTEVPGLGRKN